MDFNLVMASLIFGTVGMGMFMYGKNAGRMVPLGAGLGLMLIPYFIPNLLALLAVCGGLMALPWVLKDA
jgi:hypothetical protein